MWSNVGLTGALAAAALVAAPEVGAQHHADSTTALVREALRHGFAIEHARLAESGAEAAVRQVRGQQLPSLALESRRSAFDGVVNVGDLVNPAYRALNQLVGRDAFPTNVDATLPLAHESRLRLVQPVYAPAIRWSHRAVGRARDGRVAETRAVARELAADVRLAILAHGAASLAIDHWRAMMPLVDEGVRVSERLVAAGRATPDALLRARAERSAVQQQLLESQERRESARRALNLLVRRPLETPVPAIAIDSADHPVPMTAQDAVTRALASREELASAAATIDAADARGRAAGAAFLPTVAIALDYGMQGDRYRFDGRHDVRVASLVVQWNLFNGGQDAARRDEAHAGRDRARLAREQTAQAIELQVRQAHASATVAWSAIATAREQLAAARRAHELVARRYEEGLAAQFELIDARAAFTRAALNLILTRHGYASRLVELERAAATRDLDADLATP